MMETISEPRKQISSFAPRIFTMQIDPDKIKTLLGLSGLSIKLLQKQGQKLI